MLGRIAFRVRWNSLCIILLLLLLTPAYIFAVELDESKTFEKELPALLSQNLEKGTIGTWVKGIALQKQLKLVLQRLDAVFMEELFSLEQELIDLHSVAKTFNTVQAYRSAANSGSSMFSDSGSAAANEEDLDEFAKADLASGLLKPRHLDVHSFSNVSFGLSPHYPHLGYKALLKKNSASLLPEAKLFAADLPKPTKCSLSRGPALCVHPEAFDPMFYTPIYSNSGKLESVKKKFLSETDYSCPANTVLQTRVPLVIGVISAAKKIDSRNVARKSWVNFYALETGIVIRFFISANETFNNPKMLNDVTNEQKTHGDIIFVDDYGGYDLLAQKTNSLLNWALQHYDFEFVVKCDDDTFNNVALALQYLHEEVHGARFPVDNPSNLVSSKESPKPFYKILPKYVRAHRLSMGSFLVHALTLSKAPQWRNDAYYNDLALDRLHVMLAGSWYVLSQRQLKAIKAGEAYAGLVGWRGEDVSMQSWLAAYSRVITDSNMVRPVGVKYDHISQEVCLRTGIHYSVRYMEQLGYKQFECPIPGL